MSESRTIPPDLRQRLRAEVGFACPVAGCESPFLSYHHFDPPYSQGGEHREEGIVALCPGHHGRADRKGRDRSLYSI